MLSSLFQESDSIYFQYQGEQKRPIGGFTGSASLAFDTPSDLPQYFSINPLDPHTNRNLKGAGTPRASINVSAFRNFLFEMDSLPLDTQLNLLKYLSTKIPLAQVVFSGSNSYHAIISVQDTLPFEPHTEKGISQYNVTWKAIESYLISLLPNQVTTSPFDKACKDPARLSRTPNAVRPDTGAVQSLIDGFGGYVTADFVLSLMSKYSDEAYVAPPLLETPSNPDERGQLTKRTLEFINNWKPELGRVWAWHPEFIFAVKDLQSQNFTFDEAFKILSSVTGYLDSNDVYQMRDIWSRNNFRLQFRKKA
ncbi:MAG: hypothetical protein ACAH17_00890 [Candidatus Paceibacterota bacterium]